MRPETLAVHAGHTVDPGSGAAAPPLWLSTTFERAADGSFPHGFGTSATTIPTGASSKSALPPSRVDLGPPRSRLGQPPH